jgi:hypothetical protein
MAKKSLKESHGPLRKVVRFYMKKLEGFKTEFPFELLECGHEIQQKRDIYGYTNAHSRRCRRCRDGKAVEQKMHPTDGGLSASDGESTLATIGG